MGRFLLPWHSSIIIKQFKIHDFPTRVKFLVDVNCFKHWLQTMGTRIRSDSRDKLRILSFANKIIIKRVGLRWKHNWKCKIFNFSALRLILHRFFPAPPTLVPLDEAISSSSGEFTFASIVRAISNYFDWNFSEERSRNWFLPRNVSSKLIKSELFKCDSPLYSFSFHLSSFRLAKDWDKFAEDSYPLLISGCEKCY